MEKQYMYIKDIIAEIFRKIHIVIICMIIFAIVVPIVKYQMDVKTVEKNKKQLKVTDEPLDENLYSEEYIEFARLIDEYQEIIDESVYMSLDPFNIEIGNMACETFDNSETSLYVSYISKGGLASDLVKDGMDYSEYDLMSMITVDTIANSDVTNSNVFSVTVYAGTKEECQNLLSKLKEEINKYSDEIGEERVSFKEEKIWNGVVPSVYDNQLTTLSRISGMRTRLQGFDNSDNDNEGIEEEIKTDGVEVLLEAKIEKKNVVIGMLLGAIISIIGIVLAYVFSDKVHVDRELSDSNNIKFLGRLSDKDLGRWNKKIDCIFGRMDARADINVLLVKVINLCKKEELQDICVLGQSDKNVKSVDTIIQELSKNNISCSYCSSFDTDAEMLDKVINSDGVFLLEKLGVDSYSKSISWIQLCFEQGVKIHGYFTVR